MKSQTLSKAFQHMGLDPKGAEIYYELLGNSNKQVLTSIALKHSINRVKLYSILDQLCKNGLMDYRNGIWQSKDPAKILMNFKEKNDYAKFLESELINVVDQLSLQFDIENTSKPIRTVFGRYNCVMEYYKLLTVKHNSKNPTQYAFNSGMEINELFGTEFQEYAKRRAQNNIKIKILCNPTDKSTLKNLYLDQELLREVKLLGNKQYLGLPTWVVFEDTIIIYEPAIPKATIITDENYARIQIAMFETIWTSLPVIK